MTASQQPVRSSRRWLRRGLWSLAILELAYVLAFEWAARSGNLGDWINRRPEKMAISFASAHSYFPFWIRATGLELHGQTPRQRWRLHAERRGADRRADMQLDHAMRQALTAGRFRLHYQPQAAMDGTLVGAEALLRWRDPALGETIRQFTAYESVPGEQAVDVTWVYETDKSGDDAPTRVTLRYHYFYPHQYDLLFGLTGFRLLGLLGEYDDSRFDEDSERLIVVGEAE